MNKKLKKWTIRLFATIAVFAILLLIIVLNPLLSYANKTHYGNYTIYHSKTLNTDFTTRVNEAEKLLQKSEIFDPGFKIDICLNDGSTYPSIIKKIKGPAFAVGFYNKVVLMGNTDATNNIAELNGYRWNLTQLLAHEMIHCLQYNELGFFKSNPVANIPEWKWEGYAEYIARQNEDQVNLAKNIQHLIATEKKDNNGWISFADGTGTVIDYYKKWLLLQYCFQIKKMNWKQLLKDESTEENIQTEMMKWYEQQH